MEPTRFPHPPNNDMEPKKRMPLTVLLDPRGSVWKSGSSEGKFNGTYTILVSPLGFHVRSVEVLRTKSLSWAWRGQHWIPLLQPLRPSLHLGKSIHPQAGLGSQVTSSHTCVPPKWCFEGITRPHKYFLENRQHDTMFMDSALVSPQQWAASKWFALKAATKK